MSLKEISHGEGLGAYFRVWLEQMISFFGDVELSQMF